MKKENNRHQLILKRPASWFGDMWKDALPLGNGECGALVYGGISKETIVVTHHQLWHWGKEVELPDVHETLEQSRTYMDQGEFAKANALLSDTLKQKGYSSDVASPFPLAAITLRIGEENLFQKYTRCLDMEDGEVTIKYQQGSMHYTRRAMVSRADQVFAYEIQADQMIPFIEASVALHDTGKADMARMREQVKDSLTIQVVEDTIYYKAKNDDGRDYGIVVKVIPEGGRIESRETHLVVKESKSVLVVGKYFVFGTDGSDWDRCNMELEQLDLQYEALRQRHVAVHKSLYHTCDLMLGTKEDEKYAWSNERLLEAAYEEVASPILLEKLWHYGRYLFISGTNEKSNPFPLYGLWTGEYAPCWAQNVANENVEMMYWHLQTGGLSELIKPLIHYYYNKIPKMQENAKRLFGCKGIFLSTYSTPVNSYINPVVPVITNWIGGAGWIAQHMYGYYEFTKDQQLLEEEILPYMVEAAQFYEDYAVYEQDGTMKLYPSVSPENSPGNFVDEHHLVHLGHAMPAVYNATMDFAIIKELLTNLLKVCQEKGQYKERWNRWNVMLQAIPAYQINEDGAVKEWMHKDLKDQYCHRHMSHLYPLFPGSEVNGQKNKNLVDAFEKAVDLRELGGQCGWSLVHMAAIYNRLYRGESSISCMDMLVKGVVLSNFMMLSNDYRSMGVTMDVGQFAPIQLDANMGIVHALQEMLLYTNGSLLHFLPALPKRLESGCVKEFHFNHGTVSYEWNQREGSFTANIACEKETSIKLILPSYKKVYNVVSQQEIQCRYEENHVWVDCVGPCEIQIE